MGWTRGRLASIGLAFGLALAATAGRAEAASLVVSNLSDSGGGSLRQALTTADGNGEADIVTFTVNGTINLLSTLPTIATDLTIDGPGAALLTISGGGSVRVFRIEGGTVAIRDVTIADGFARGGDGGDAPGNRGGGGGGGLGAGGGVYAESADLTLENVILSGNRARGGDGGDGGPGCNGCASGLAAAGGTSSLGSAGGSGAGSAGAGGGGGGAGGGFTTGGNGNPGNSGGGGGQGGSRQLVGGLSDVGNGSGGSGAGCGGGSTSFQIAGDFAGGGGSGIQNCLGSGGGGGGGGGLGGGIYLRSGSLTLDGVSFVGNEARRGTGGSGGSGGGPGQGKGGALFVDRDGEVTSLTPASFSGNVADDDAGTCNDNDDLYNRGVFPNDPPTALDLSPTSVPENQPAGTVVGTFSTTDASASDTHTYALVSGTGSTHNGQFSIVGDQLRTAAIFDRETQPTRSIRVRTTDACGQSVEAPFTITVTNVNESPVGVVLTPATVDENQPAATVVGTLSTVDPDAVDTHTYALVAGVGDADNGDFTISGNTLLTAATFDHETQPTRSIRVRTTDAGGLSHQGQVTVTVNDLNEAPSVTPAAFSVAENSAAGTIVGTVTATDPEPGTVLTWSIEGGNAGGAFAIGAASGQITVAGALDHETTPSYSLTVRATDDGSPTLFGEAIVTITIDDLNEAPSLSPAAFAVAESSSGGTVVGTVTGTDPDAGTTLTYSIEGGNVGGAFAIGAASGQLTVAGALDHETTPSYSLTVRATDDGSPTLFAEATVTITVDDVNEPPVATEDAYASDEDVPLVVAAPGVLGNDGDPDLDPLTVVGHDPSSSEGATVTVAADGSFHYDPTAAAALQALGDGQSVIDTFTYTVADPGGLETDGVVRITVAGTASGLVLTKEALSGVGLVPIGSTLTYRLTVENPGSGVEAAVAVTDPLPAEVTFLSSACATAVGGTVFWDPGDLGSGDSLSCEFEVTVDQRGTIVNTAFATSLDLPGEIEAAAAISGGSIVEIPTLDWPGLLLLALLLAGLSWRRLG